MRASPKPITSRIGESAGRWYKSGMSALRPALRRHLLVLLLYSLLGLALTYPLISHFATHVPGDGIDDPALAWNLWWLKFSLVDRQLNPFLSQWMFYPIGINLAFYTLTILNGLLSIPLQVAWGLVPASNLVLLSSFVLSGFGAYLLAADGLVSGVKCRVSSRGDRGSVAPSSPNKSRAAPGATAECEVDHSPLRIHHSSFRISCRPALRLFLQQALLRLRSARPTSPARSGSRLRFCTSYAAAGPARGCASRCWPRSLFCSRPTPS